MPAHHVDAEAIVFGRGHRAAGEESVLRRVARRDDYPCRKECVNNGAWLS